MKTCTLINQRSGTARQIMDQVASLARRSNSRLIVLDRNQILDVVLNEALDAGCDRLIVAGGDGTNSRVLNALGRRMQDVQWALLPLGTGNDFARNLGLVPYELEMAWEIAMQGKCLPVDVVALAAGDTPDGPEMPQHYFLNAATGGMGGKVAGDVCDADKQRWGSFAYWKCAVASLANLQPYQVRVVLDGQQQPDASIYGLCIANGRTIGGGFQIAPSASINDGLLDVTMVPEMPTIELLAAGLQFTLDNGPPATVQYTQCGSVRIHAEPSLPFSIDGEPTRTVDALFYVVPAALNVVCGPAVADSAAQRETETVD